jgi:hypothetical protein
MVGAPKAHPRIVVRTMRGRVWNWGEVRGRVGRMEWQSSSDLVTVKKQVSRAEQRHVSTCPIYATEWLPIGSKEAPRPAPRRKHSKRALGTWARAKVELPLNCAKRGRSSSSVAEGDAPRLDRGGAAWGSLFGISG